MNDLRISGVDTLIISIFVLFLDLINAMVIKFFLGLPIMQGGFGG